MNRYFIFPEPLDSECVLTTDGGIVIQGQPDTHPGNGAPCQSYAIPPTVPNGNGASQRITHAGMVKDEHHGILAWGELAKVMPAGQAAFFVDVFPLQQVPVRPFEPAPRTYRGNMCGIRLSGLPPIPGVNDPALVLSWFIDRYSAEDRKRIYDAYHSRQIVDVLVSWPDSRAYGSSPEQFGRFCEELVNEGFIPCVMLSSKYYDPNYDWQGVQANIAPVLPYLERVVGRHCVGFELSLWLSPLDVQCLTDWLAALVNPWGGKLYVHFQQGYASFDFDGPNASFAGYWNRNIGKLTGILHQRDLEWDKPMYQARLVDVLERFAGNFNCSPDSGFGHPFDLIALEITAQDQFDGSCTEAQGNAWGDTALTTPPSYGPLGIVPVQGSGNGQSR